MAGGGSSGGGGSGGGGAAAGGSTADDSGVESSALGLGASSSTDELTTANPDATVVETSQSMTMAGTPRCMTFLRELFLQL